MKEYKKWLLKDLKFAKIFQDCKVINGHTSWQNEDKLGFLKLKLQLQIFNQFNSYLSELKVRQGWELLYQLYLDYLGNPADVQWVNERLSEGSLYLRMNGYNHQSLDSEDSYLTSESVSNWKMKALALRRKVCFDIYWK